VDEAGVPGAYFLTWYSLWAPKGTPKDIVARLGAAVAAALAGPAIKARFADLGLDVAPPDQQSADGLFRRLRSTDGGPSSRRPTLKWSKSRPALLALAPDNPTGPLVHADEVIE
jgi:hypothetical protein